MGRRSVLAGSVLVPRADARPSTGRIWQHLNERMQKNGTLDSVYEATGNVHLPAPDLPTLKP